MYITPATTIRLMKRTGLLNNYSNTIYFASKSERDAFFATKTVTVLSEYSYQREKKAVRIGKPKKDLEQIDYIAFRNEGYNERTYYAFVTSCEYVNDVTTDLFFELDVIQTYLLDCTLYPSFIERQHTASDEIGEHIAPESVDVGEYVYNGYGKLTQALDPMAVIMLITDEEEDADGSLYDGIYGGCNMYAFNSTDTESIKSKLNAYIKKPESVVAMYMAPTVAVGAIPSGGVKVTYSSEPTELTLAGSALDDTATLDGYLPKNKKLYTYPYNFFATFSPSGSQNFRYEFFKNLTPNFKVDVPLTQPIQVRLSAVNYKGASEDVTDSLVMASYPQCSWSNNSFKTWMAQNTIPILKAVGNVATSTTLTMAGVPSMGGIDGVRNLMAQGYQASQKADVVRGNTASGNVAVATKTQTFYGARMSVSKVYAEMLDSYFTRYGYSIKKVSQPNINARPHWTYIKVADLSIKGGAPAEAIAKIASIFQNGVTFWKNGDEIGRFDLDNSI